MMIMFFKKALRKVLNILGNFFIFNNLLVLFRSEKKVKNFINPYVDKKIDDTRQSLLQIAGYSNRPEIIEVLNKNHENLKRTVVDNIAIGSKILDIGCGPGLYLKDFYDDYKVTGTDISPEMIRISKKHLPNANFVVGNFIDLKFDEKFNFVYCTGFLLYVPRMDIKYFFQKVNEILEPGGVFFLCFPHAISIWDLLYPNLNYIQYSPSYLINISKPYFNVIDHHHNIDDRKVELFDRKPYVSSNPDQNKTYRNSYVIIFKKR